MLIGTSLPVWYDAYNAVLSGENEFGIDFKNYYIDGTADGNPGATRRYHGCDLYDIDNDETPEMFINVGLYDSMYTEVYAYKDGKAKYMGRTFGTSIEKSTGIIFDSSMASSELRAYKYTASGIEQLEKGYVEINSTAIDEYGNAKYDLKLGDRTYKDYFNYYNSSDNISDKIVELSSYYNLKAAIRYSPN